MKTALIIGSSGLIGKQLLSLLLESKDYDKVIVFNRKEMALNHPKLVQQLIDFEDIPSYKNLIKGDDFFCTIGTTIKKAGNKEAFRKVDFSYPKQFAEIAKTNNINPNFSPNRNSSRFPDNIEGLKIETISILLLIINCSISPLVLR